MNFFGDYIREAAPGSCDHDFGWASERHGMPWCWMCGLVLKEGTAEELDCEITPSEVGIQVILTPELLATLEEDVISAGVA